MVLGLSIHHVITSGNIFIAIGLSALAGFVSFVSPCVLPLVPAYLSQVSGISAADAQSEQGNTKKVVFATSLFVLGFSVVFVALGAAMGEISSFLLAYRFLLLRLAGVLVIVMGLFMLGWLKLPILFREARLTPKKMPKGTRGAFPLGVIFGLGWTPCIGPTLAVVLGIAASSGSITRGAILLLFYSLGLGVPFLLMAIGFRSALQTFTKLRRHVMTFERLGGAMMVLIGVLLVTGFWGDFIVWVQDRIASTGYTPPL